MTNAAAIRSGHRANLLGSLWMIVSMAAFAVEDALVKSVSSTLPVGQVLILFGLGGVLLFAGLALTTGETLFHRDALSRPMRIRVLFEITGRLFYVLAISLIPLSTATVILQATPLAVVAGAALFLGEQVGWRRWTAIAIGFSGVVIIAQPGADGFSLLSGLAIAGMLGFAGRDLASRLAPATLGTATLGFYGFLSIIVAGLLVSFWQAAPFVLPGAASIFWLSGAIIAGVLAYSCLMKAMRTGDVSSVTPFRYTRLLFGLGLGIVVFEEKISGATVLGSGLIVLSGIFILWRTKHSSE